MPLLNSRFTITTGQNQTVYALIPDKFKNIYSLACGILFIVLFIVAVVKLNKLGKNEEEFINEVYLNQKTKQEIMEEDEQVNFVKWNDNEPSSIETGEVVEENNIPFQTLSELNGAETTENVEMPKVEQNTMENVEKEEEPIAIENINEILNEEPQEELNNVQNVLVLTTNKPEETIDVEE
ncbi:MAG: hypothetical protein E7062_04260, partial [Spirochaetaceae bacterium]|nr:hypothetical protein [Spirochaetaceae bacterium]